MIFQYYILDLDRAIALSLAESNNHGLNQTDIMTYYDSKKSGNDSNSFDDDEIVILEPTVAQQSSRRGGFAFPIIKQEVLLSEDESEDEPQPSTSHASLPSSSIEINVDPKAPVKDDLFADVFQDKSKLPSDEKEEPGIEISVGIIEDSDSSSEEDLFADVFKDPNTDPSALDEILKRAEVKKHEEKVEIAKTALAESETKEELFAKIAKKARKEEVNEEIPAAQLTQKMKNSGHLFLQIASKYAEEQEEKKVPKSPEKPKKVTETNDLKSRLDQEGQDLVREMQAKAKESKLLLAKQSKTVSAPVERPTPKSPKNIDEDELLEALKVQAQSKSAYSQGLLEDQMDEQSVDSEIYGASAPGFVRSKNFNVTEVEARQNHPSGLDESILKKIEASEDDTKNPDNVLSEEELRKIQVPSLCKLK